MGCCPPKSEVTTKLQVICDSNLTVKDASYAVLLFRKKKILNGYKRAKFTV